MQKFEKLSDYKRAVKALVRGSIKAKIFVDDKCKLSLKVLRSTDGDVKTVNMFTDNGTYVATFEAEVSTRIFNKIDDDFFAPIIEQVAKLKGFGGLEVQFVLN